MAIPLVVAEGVSVSGIADSSRFGVMAILVIEKEAVANAKSPEIEVGLPDLPGKAALLPCGPLNNQSTPNTPKISTMQARNTSRSRRLLIGFTERTFFTGLPLISGGKGASSLRIKTGQSVCCRPARQNER